MCVDTSVDLGDIAGVVTPAHRRALLAMVLACRTLAASGMAGLGAAGLAAGCSRAVQSEDIRPDPSLSGQGGGGAGGQAVGQPAGSGGSNGGDEIPGAASGGAAGSPVTPDAAPADNPDLATPDVGAGSSDVGSGPSAPVETISVPASGSTVTTTSKLDLGELYLLRASGVVDLAGASLDAEFLRGGLDSIGGVDLGIDNGMKELILPGAGSAAPMVGPNRMKWFGPARADHVYYMIVTGAGAPMPFRLIRPAGGGAGTGVISVAIFRLTPAGMSGGIGKALDTIMVAFKPRTAIETSVLKPATGSVVLLRAFGEAQVGGVGNNGDAEFDDYKGGTSANEGEGGKDFGICVDEPCSVKRARKWGPYRPDHDYYMLYAGRGMAINFAYCDTGTYADNAGGLPVEIYAVP